MKVKRVGKGARAFLGDAEVIQRVGVCVVRIERQTAIGTRSQGNKACLVIRACEASAPIQRSDLGISQGPGPGDEAGFEQGPERTGSVRRPEGIPVVGIKHCRGSSAGGEAGTEAAAGSTQHSLKPRLSGNGAGVLTSLELSRHCVESLSKGLIRALGSEHVWDMVQVDVAIKISGPTAHISHFQDHPTGQVALDAEVDGVGAASNVFGIETEVSALEDAVGVRRLDSAR